MEILWIILAVAFVVGLYFLLTWKKKRGNAELDDKIIGFDLPEKELPYQHRTPQGGLLRSYRSSVTTALLNSLDHGRRQYLRSTEHLGWLNRRGFSDFEVWELPPTSQSEQGYPTLNMLNGQKIAGITIGVQNIILENPFVVIPEISKPEHYSYASDVVRFELEHRDAYFNDRAEFERGAVIGHSHPLHKLPEEMIRGIVGQPKSHFVCGGV